MTVLVDSCGWIEYVADGPLAETYRPLLEDVADVVVPTVVLFEVFRWVRREGTHDQALLVVAQMKQGRVRPLVERVALLAAELAERHQLAMADAFIYAHARADGVPLVSSDAHFASLTGVVFHPKS